VQQIIALSRVAVVVRHWFEINLNDASMQHGARIELRELAVHPHRGSESAAQLVTADRPWWRADLFDRLADRPGSFGAAHYHPEFSGNEPSSRVWDPKLTASPWAWLGDQFSELGAGPGEPGKPERKGWPLQSSDAAELSRLAADIVAVARQFSPDRCGSAAECFGLTRDAGAAVRLMISCLRRPDLLDADWVRPWTTAA
jgi:hypothetical protein